MDTRVCSARPAPGAGGGTRPPTARRSHRDLGLPDAPGAAERVGDDDRAAQPGGSARAEASGSRGSRRRGRPPPALDWSTPAFAHTKPWWVRQMSRPASARTSSAVSPGSAPRAAGPCRARRRAPGPARPAYVGERGAPAPRPWRPTLCATASTSPRASPGSGSRAAASASSAARSSPAPDLRAGRERLGAQRRSRRAAPGRAARAAPASAARRPAARRARRGGRRDRRACRRRAPATEPARRARGAGRRGRARRGGRTSPGRTTARSRRAA